MTDHRMPQVTAKIKQVMKTKRVTQTELAELTGIAFQSLHRTLNNRTPIYVDELLTIIKALGIELNDLMQEMDA